MKKLFFRATAWFMALFITVSLLGGVPVANAAEEKVLDITSDMATKDGNIVIRGGTWDRVVVSREIGARKVLLDNVTAKNLVIESGTSCTFEVAGGKFGTVTILSLQLEAVDYEKIKKLLDEGASAQEVSQLYHSYLEEKEYLQGLVPVFETKEEANIGLIQVFGNVRLKLEKGKVGEAKIYANGIQNDMSEILRVRIVGYDGKVSVNQKEGKSGVWSVLSLHLESSNLAELVIEGTERSSCYIDGQTSMIKKAELVGSIDLAMMIKAEEVKLSSKTKNISLSLYSEVKNMIVEGNKNNIYLASYANVEKAEVKGNDVKIYGGGRLNEAVITGKGANVSTSGTKVDGENNYTPPVGQTPLRPSATPAPKPTGKPEGTPVPKPTSIPTPIPTETSAEMFYYEENKGGGITISGLSESGKDLTEIVIPKEIDGKEVTEIKASAFFGRQNLVSISLPNSISKIGNSAFRDCRNLVGIDLPKGISRISDRMFSGCSSLKSIILPENISIIENCAFSDCGSLTNIILPDSVIEIGGSVFSNCISITSMYIPANVTRISGNVFSGCTSLYEIKVDSENSVYTSVNGVLYTKTGHILVAYPCARSEKKYTILKGTERIGDGAFSGCTNLTNIEIPEGITDIYDEAFSACNSLISIELPTSVMWIGKEIFRGCDSLKEIKVSAENSMYTSINGVLYTKDRKELIAFPGGYFTKSYLVAEGTEKIGDYAFAYCNNVEDIILPESIREIGFYAFRDCSRLANITLPKGIVQIGTFAFLNCSSLTSIVLPEGIVETGYGAFEGCINLERVALPESIIKISDNTFFGCRSLAGIILPESVTEIGESAFRCCSALLSITLSERVSKIGNYAFLDCESLTSIELPEGITEIGDGVFEGCSNLKRIILPDGINKIGFFTFRNCSSLESIVLPESITEIGEYAFENCSNLTGMVLPENIIRIENHTFLNCIRLSSVTLSENIVEIGTAAFKYIARKADGTIETATGSTLTGTVIIRGMDITIADDAFEGSGSLLFKVKKGSAAEVFLRKKNYTIEYLPEE